MLFLELFVIVCVSLIKFFFESLLSVKYLGVVGVIDGVGVFVADEGGGTAVLEEGLALDGLDGEEGAFGVAEVGQF